MGYKLGDLIKSDNLRIEESITKDGKYVLRRMPSDNLVYCFCFYLASGKPAISPIGSRVYDGKETFEAALKVLNSLI